MDDELLVLRLTELRAQLAELTKRLEGLDGILADGVTDEAVKKYAEELTKIIDEREPILNEVRSLLVMADKNAPDNPPAPLKGGRDGGAMVN